MNVAELIDALSAVEDKTAKVYTEGCDCHGEVAGVEPYIGDSVIIARPEWEDE